MPQLDKIMYFYPACGRLAPDRERNLQASPGSCPGFLLFMQLALVIIASLGAYILCRFAIFNNLGSSVLVIIASLGAVAVLKIANHLARRNWFAL